MPIYEYKCNSCGKAIELLQKISDPAPASCTHCQVQDSMVKIMSQTAFVLKGGGWYADAYSSTSKKSDSGSAKADSTPASSTSSPKSSD